jgi:hypothetical protein
MSEDHLPPISAVLLLNELLIMCEYHLPTTSVVQILFSELFIVGEDHLPPISAVLLLFS